MIYNQKLTIIMEAPVFNFSAAYSALSNGPDKPVSMNGGGIDDKCALEIPIEGPNRGLRFLCVGMLHKKFGIPYYKPCDSANGECPLNQFQRTLKPIDASLDIETRWKQNNGSA
jgi:hypothetical protein